VEEIAQLVVEQHPDLNMQPAILIAAIRQAIRDAEEDRVIRP
jgi:hypothetical protein